MAIVLLGQTTITGAEYFIDVDLGEGKCISLNASDGNFDSGTEGISFEINSKELGVGVHWIYFRFQNSEGKWGQPRAKMVTISHLVSELHVKGAEFFIDKDPGKGLGITLQPEDGEFNEVEENLIETYGNTEGLMPGEHILYIRGISSDSVWGEKSSIVFTTFDDTPPTISLEWSDSLIILCTRDTLILHWNANDNVGIFRTNIYAAMNWSDFDSIGTVYASTNKFEWIIPDILTDSLRFMVIAYDSSGNVGYDTLNHSISIIDKTLPEIIITKPASGFKIKEYNNITVKWVATDNIELDSVHIYYSNDGGLVFNHVGDVPSDSAQFKFNIPAGVTDCAKIKLIAVDIYSNKGEGYSGYFSVTDNTTPSIQLTSDFSTQRLEIGNYKKIQWAASDNVAIRSIGLFYSSSGGSNWIEISTDEENDGEYSWLVPNDPSEQCKIKVVAIDSVGLSGEDISEGLFTIIITYPKLIFHYAFILPLDTVKLGFSQALKSEQFDVGLILNSAVIGDMIYNYQFENNNQYVSIYPDNSFVSGDTLSLILLADKVTNIFGYGLDSNQNEVFEGSPVDNDTVTVLVNYSGDFNSNDQVDFDDLALFANGWYSKDYKYELGPVTGDIPYFITMADSLFNVEDAMTFGRMWNWFVRLGKHTITLPKVLADGGFTTEQKGNIMIVSTKPAAGKRIVLKYDPQVVTISKKSENLFKPSEMTFEFYTDCHDSGSAEYVHYSFIEESGFDSISFSISTKSREPIVLTIGVEGIDNKGNLIFADIQQVCFQPIPDKFTLYQNYPNPFNAQTIISYGIPLESHVIIKIYDLLGREVRKFLNNKHDPNYYRIIWDGKDDFGRELASGIYFCSIVAKADRNKFTKTKKIILLR